MIFKQCIEIGVFPSEWKKLILFLFMKKETNFDKTTIYYRCGKIVERLLSKEMLNEMFGLFLH